jgi:hypothetical protein
MATSFRFEFHEAMSPRDIQLLPNERLDVIGAMETIEHLPPEDVDAYFQILANRLGGWLFVTVPNEKGPLFLFKWLVTSLITRDGEKYSWPEVVAATIGRTDRVKRDQHKGFDYDALVRQMARYFDVRSVSGHPMAWLPPNLCFSVGIVATPRRAQPAVSTALTSA